MLHLTRMYTAGKYGRVWQHCRGVDDLTYMSIMQIAAPERQRPDILILSLGQDTSIKQAMRV